MNNKKRRHRLLNNAAQILAALSEEAQTIAATLHHLTDQADSLTRGIAALKAQLAQRQIPTPPNQPSRLP